MNSLSANTHTRGMAIIVPVCSTQHCCNHTSQVHHLTLAHLSTRDRKIVDLTLERIKSCIETNHYLSQTKNGKVATYTIISEGPSSTFLGGNVELFKQSLDAYLRIDSRIAPHLSPYRPTHIDRHGRNPSLFKEFRMEQLNTMLS